MIAVVQRVTAATVTVAAEACSATIGTGLCVLLCAEEGDDPQNAVWMAGKLARLRVFADDQGRMNRSVRDIDGEVLMISQFTLAGDCRRGNRPSFVTAASPETGRSLFDLTCEIMSEEHGVPVTTGVFGAMMDVELCNNGPVTLILRTPVRGAQTSQVAQEKGPAAGT